MSTKKADLDEIGFCRHDSFMSINPAQSRSARAWLGLTQGELAEQARIGLSTLKEFESGARTPIANNLEAIERALAGAGAAEFLAATSGLTTTDDAGRGRTQPASGLSERQAPKSRPARPRKRTPKGGRG